MNNILYKNIIVDSSSELVPQIRISPFSLQVASEESDVYNVTPLLSIKDKHISYHLKGRYALSAALSDLNLESTDSVTILTTSGNYYVSGCVTRTIESVCTWDREISENTKAILVIHEFGYPYKNIENLKKHNVPIIEDCAYAFINDPQMGQIGDYVIYSLPKSFNMQIGGLLYSKSLISDSVTSEQRAYVDNHLNSYLSYIELYRSRRLKNFVYLKEKLNDIDIVPYFSDNDNIPGVFLFSWRDDVDYPDLKKIMQQNGVESSVFYGQNAFFIPIHQNLSDKELDYMINLLKYYYEFNVI